ncbi:MAG: hypothetical protein AAB443_02905, partial [Patescibacteria group bacterium]
MQRVGTKDRLVFLFSFYVFLAIFFGSIIFLIYFRGILTHQIKSDISKEIGEITDKFIYIEEGEIQLVKDANGGTQLKEDLLRDGISALLLGNNLEVIRGFGLFEIYNQADAATINKIVENSKTAMSSGKVTEATLEWQANKVFVYFFPLKREGQVRGVLILGKSLDTLNTLSKSVMFSFLSFMLLGILGSLLLGYVLVRQALKPLHDLNKILDQTDLQSLDKTLQVDGPDTDEFVILSRKFND